MAATGNGKLQTMMIRSTSLIVTFVAGALWLVAGSAQISAESRACGTGWNDWCPSQKGDRCNRHKTKEACMADRRCYGMPYRGESFVPCFLDERGFASNCPTVGCTSVRPPKDSVRKPL